MSHTQTLILSMSHKMRLRSHGRMSEEPSCYRGRDRAPHRRHATPTISPGAACRGVAGRARRLPSRKRPPRAILRDGGRGLGSNPTSLGARWAGLPAYEGTTDSAGRPHGRGRLRLDEDGAWYEGRFWRGVRQGRGTPTSPSTSTATRTPTRTLTPDASDPRFPSGGDRVTGTFADDAVEGWATYHCADGSSREGIWRDGELSGLVRERDPTGRVVFEGDTSPARATATDGSNIRTAASSRARSKTATSSPVAPCTPTRTRTASRRAAPSARRVFKPQRRHARPSTPWANPEPSSETSQRRRRPRKSPTPSASRFGEAPVASARTRKNTNRHVDAGVRNPPPWSSGYAAVRRRRRRRRRRRVGRTLTRLSFGRGVRMLRTSRVGDVGVVRRRVRGRGRDRGGSRARRTSSFPRGARRVRPRGETRGGGGDFRSGGVFGWRAPDGWRRRARVRVRVRTPRVRGSTLGRWRPDGQRAFYLRANDDDSEDEYDDEDGREPSLGGGGAGGIFSSTRIRPRRASHRRTAGSAGIRAARRARPLTCRREKFRHPLLGETWALVAERRLGGGDAVTQPPDYEGGWRVCPVSEAGYYRHLTRTPPP